MRKPSESGGGCESSKNSQLQHNETPESSIPVWTWYAKSGCRLRQPPKSLPNLGALPTAWGLGYGIFGGLPDVGAPRPVIRLDPINFSGLPARKLPNNPQRLQTTENRFIVSGLGFRAYGSKQLVLSRTGFRVLGLQGYSPKPPNPPNPQPLNPEPPNPKAPNP